MSRAKPASGEESPGVDEAACPSLPQATSATSASIAATNAIQRFIASFDRLADAAAARHTELRSLRPLLVERDELSEARIIDRVQAQLNAPRGRDHRFRQA